MFVDARDFNLGRNSKSLSLKNLGPWKITRSIDGKAYEVAVPPYMQEKGIFNVFYPWKLHLAPDNPYPGQVQELGPVYMIFDDDEEEAYEEWEVLEVVDCRNSRYGT